VYVVFFSLTSQLYETNVECRWNGNSFLKV